MSLSSRGWSLPSWNLAAGFAVLALGATWFVVSCISRNDAPTDVRPLTHLPLELGRSWAGQVLELPSEQAEVLRATEVLLRNYHPLLPSTATVAGKGSSLSRPPPVLLFIAYYQSQRTGATYHSPKHCLPGGGWQFADQRRTRVPGPHVGEVEVNEILMEKGLERQLVLYWFQDRGRVLASEYSAKVYLVWDAATKNRSDGALVRVSAPVEGGDVAGARKRVLAFISDLWVPLADVLEGANR